MEEAGHSSVAGALWCLPGLPKPLCLARSRPVACPVFHLSLILGTLGALGMAWDLPERIHAGWCHLGGRVTRAKLFWGR